MKLRARHGAVPQFDFDSTFPNCFVAAPIFTSRSVEALGSLIGCSLKLFFSAGIISMGIGARHERW
jgi:hypothetical protein